MHDPKHRAANAVYGKLGAPLIHASQAGLDALAAELLAEKPFATATVVGRLYLCRACSRAREVFRAKDNRAIYAHLCRACFDRLPISHSDHYEYVTLGEAP